MVEKYFVVVFSVGATGSICVKAKDEEEAKKIAETKFFPSWESCELGDPDEIVDCNELTEEEYLKSDRR